MKLTKLANKRDVKETSDVLKYLSSEILKSMKNYEMNSKYVTMKGILKKMGSNYQTGEKKQP